MNWKKLINIAIKALLVLLLLHAVLFPELAQYQDKGMKYRYFAYPLCAFAVYIFHNLIRKKNAAYPYLQDLLITSIITLDMLGNTLGFYGSIEWWDDIMHFINSGLLTMFFYSIIEKHLATKLLICIVAIGVLAWLQVTWELLEYLAFITSNGQEMTSAYRDTIGDLALGQIGSLAVAAVILLITNKNTKSY